MNLLLRVRLMLRAARNHEEVTCFEGNDSVPQPDLELSLQDEEEVVSVFMLVP
jgi:hypothetical protein